METQNDSTSAFSIDIPNFVGSENIIYFNLEKMSTLFWLSKNKIHS